MTTSHESQMPFIKNLASSDRKLRTASLDTLKLFLSSRTTLTHTDALKLWKGLYYALYMTDRPAPQQRLASDLASLSSCLSNKPAATQAAWFAGFWEVLAERWPHIDALRMDKFLLLVRRVFASQLVSAAAADGDGEEMLEVFREWPFDVEGDMRKMALGLRLHVLDLWVDELHKAGFLNEEEQEEDKGRVMEAVGKMVQALIHCNIKAVRERARDSHDDGRLPWGNREVGDDMDEDEDEDEEWGGIDDE